MKIETTIRRLELLRDHIMRVKSEEFDFSTWWERSHELKCGFTGCSLGHACYVPEFKRLGLKLAGRGMWRTPVVVRKRKRIAEDLEAAMVIFGISHRLANILFTPDTARSPSREITSQEWAEFATRVINRLKKKRGIKQRPQSVPLARKLIPAELPVLPETPHNPTSDRPDAVLSRSAPSDRSACFVQPPSSGSKDVADTCLTH